MSSRRTFTSLFGVLLLASIGGNSCVSVGPEPSCEELRAIVDSTKDERAVEIMEKTLQRRGCGSEGASVSAVPTTATPKDEPSPRAVGNCPPVKQSAECCEYTGACGGENGCVACGGCYECEGCNCTCGVA